MKSFSLNTLILNKAPLAAAISMTLLSAVVTASRILEGQMKDERGEFNRLGFEEQLHQELNQLGRPDTGIVLKIENREAFDNLPWLLLTGILARMDQHYHKRGMLLRRLKVAEMERV